MKSEYDSFFSDYQEVACQKEVHFQAEHLTSQGELRLLHNDPAGLDLFDAACQIDQECPYILYRQGLALFEYGSEAGQEKIYRIASQKFKRAVQLDPSLLGAWQAWGDLLCCQALVTGQHDFILRARENFERAIALLKPGSAEEIAELHWHHGFVLLQIARQSKEAIDYQLAIESFQKASTHPQFLCEEFWVCFGLACCELGLCINDIRLLVKALHCFKHAVSLAVTCYEAWRSMGTTLKALYEKTHDEDHFTQANECFSTVAQLRPDVGSLWLDWAVFLCESGKRTHDVKRLRAAVEKCQRAAALDGHLPRILATWGETLALIGEFTERLDLLHEAHNKVSEAAQNAPRDHLVWLSYGMCLQSFGHYFQDIDYYYQAIEKHQIGLSCDRTCHQQWHAIACTYLMVGTIEEEVEALERAHRFFNRAIDLHPSSIYLFDCALTLSKLGELQHNQEILEQSINYFERALSLQKNAVYLHPEWLFYYASTLDMLGDFHEEISFYSRAIEIFSHVLTVDPDFPMIHHRLGLAFSHMGELLEDLEYFQRALHCLRLAAKRDEDNDQILLDWAVTLINISQYTIDPVEIELSSREAELKLIQCAKLGNLQAYYQLACLNSLFGHHERSLRFIEKADEFDALPSLDELLHDDWLEGLRSTHYFRDFLQRIEKTRVSEKDD